MASLSSVRTFMMSSLLAIHGQSANDTFERSLPTFMTTGSSLMQRPRGPELDFLGHRVNSQGIVPLSSRVAAVQDFPQPSSLTKLCQFLGLINFYQRSFHCAPPSFIHSEPCSLTSMRSPHHLFPRHKKPLPCSRPLRKNWWQRHFFSTLAMTSPHPSWLMHPAQPLVPYFSSIPTERGTL